MSVNTTFATTWATPVLTRISAPALPSNLATLWGWSAQEKTGLHPAPDSFNWDQWYNPLNTTQPMPGAVNVNSVGVKSYLSLADGIAATGITLLNGHYPDIVTALRQNLPASLWGAAARSQLDTWGTGSGWLNYVSQEDDMTPEEHNMLVQMYSGLGYGTGAQAGNPVARVKLDQIGASLASLSTALAALQAAVSQLGSAIDVSGLTAQITSVETKIDRLLAELHTP